jgi:hypothetical protein
MKTVTVVCLGGIVVAAVLVFAIVTPMPVSPPVVKISNLSSSAISELRIETDVNESYILHPLQSGESQTQTVTGRDKLLWVAGRRTTGELVESDRIYVTSQGTVSAYIDNDSIELEYACCARR